MGAIIFRHDGNGGGFYTLDGKRIKNGDRIFVTLDRCSDPEKLECSVEKVKNQERCHNDSWTSYTDVLTLSFYRNEIRCNISPSEFSRRVFYYDFYECLDA